jgi:hypothetical protein
MPPSIFPEPLPERLRLRAKLEEKTAEKQDKILERWLRRATTSDKKDEFDEIYESIMNDFPVEDKSSTYNQLCSPTGQGGLSMFTSISRDKKQMVDLGKSLRPRENKNGISYSSENLKTFALITQQETPLRYLTHGLAAR